MVAQWLGASIQQQVGAHSAEEDARAALLLFRDHVLLDASQLQGQDLEGHFLHEIYSPKPPQETACNVAAL